MHPHADRIIVDEHDTLRIVDAFTGVIHSEYDMDMAEFTNRVGFGADGRFVWLIRDDQRVEFVESSSGELLLALDASSTSYTPVDVLCSRSEERAIVILEDRDEQFFCVVSLREGRAEAWVKPEGAFRRCGWARLSHDASELFVLHDRTTLRRYPLEPHE